MNTLSTEKITTNQIGNIIDELMQTGKDSRKGFERRWYDNNFFDDGFHFRYVSRTQNKIVDLAESRNIYSPLRAIPKASRQIRGVANLLLSQDPKPIVYPKYVNKAFYPPQMQFDPQLQQQVQLPNPEYLKALEEAKRVARLTSCWLKEEFKDQDLDEKLALMAILTMKHGVSYLQITPDAVNEAIRTQVYDAFDIYLQGNLTEIQDSPFIGKVAPESIARIKANEMFDAKQREKISPDNKMASSEIKDAYMKARFGDNTTNESGTLLLKEFFIKEYLNQQNMFRIRKQKDGDKILQGKDEGDSIIRQVFVAGNIALKDDYVNLSDYPFVDFRLEPGPIYQVPLIERFIPANKSLDLVSSRIEAFTHTMVAGSWSKKKGESYEISNTPGGQVFEYENTPPIQNQVSSVPAFVFSYMSFLTGLIEEQGVTTTTLGKLPQGVKAHSAIESLKESEYASLVIASKRLKGTVKRIAEQMLAIADSHFISPKVRLYLDTNNEPQYFNTIGQTALDRRNELKVETPEDVIPISREAAVDIEVQSGVAYTKEGQKEAARQLGDYMLQLSQLGVISPEAVKKYLQKMLEMYEFGATQEIMDAANEETPINEEQTDRIKVAVMEVFKDLMQSGVLPSKEERIQETKVANVETEKDLRGLKKQTGQVVPQEGINI